MKEEITKPEIDYELYYIRLLKGEKNEEIEEMATCELDHYYETECRKYDTE